MSFFKYLELIKDSYSQAVKVEWLNNDETVNFEFTDAIYDMSADVDVNYQDGSRRSCTIVLNNDNNLFPVNFNSIWIGQKFKLWMGIYINETPYYFPQGVFYVSNPDEVYEPNTRTITLHGVDKWAWLDGTLNGILSTTYQTSIGVNLRDATKAMLKQNGAPRHIIRTPSQTDMKQYLDLDVDTDYDGTITYKNDFTLTMKVRYSGYIEFSYVTDFAGNFNCTFTIKKNDIIITDGETATGDISGSIIENVEPGDKIICQLVCKASSLYCKVNLLNFIITPCEPIDPISPLISNDLYVLAKDNEGKEKKTMNCPYTATVERGKTYADVLLEYAKILRAKVYYDVNGRLVLEPMKKDVDDITDTDKEILWQFTVEEKNFLGLSQTFNFDKVYNDFIVLGNIANGYQFKGRVQNKNPMSNTSIQRIGLKTKEPYEDNQYTSDKQCIELATYYAKMNTILQKSGSISSTPLYHLDVDKLVTVSTPNNNMSKELFLISGYSLSSKSSTMSISVASVNMLKDFSVVEVT